MPLTSWQQLLPQEVSAMRLRNKLVRLGLVTNGRAQEKGNVIFLKIQGFCLERLIKREATTYSRGAR